MRAAVYAAPGRVEVRELPRPQIGPDELLVRAWGVGLCGTDITKLQHGIGSPGTVLGHELVGWVAEAGQDVTTFRVGERVAATHHVPCYTCRYCLRGDYSMCKTFKATAFDPGGFSEYVRLSALHVRHTTFPLPDTLAFEEAVFIEPVACCLRSMQRAGVRLGDVVWIIGAGSSGLLLALSAMSLRATVVISDLIDQRLSLARELGVEVTANPQRDDAADLLRSLSAGRGADVVIPTVVSASIVQEAMAAVRDGGTVLLFGSTPSQREVPLDLYGQWRREINLLTSYSPDPVSLADAYDLLVRHRLNVRPIISHEVPLAEIGRAIEMVSDARATKVIVRIAS
jgi:L-iditol 2-dehydrogenase